MDNGSSYTDRRAKMLELRLQRVYRGAQKDLEQGFDRFLKRHMKKGTEMLKKLADGEITQQQYADWMRSQVAAGKKWQQQIDDATDRLKTANEKALRIVREEQLNVFTENANYEEYQIEKDYKGTIRFDIYDEQTVERLVDEKPELMPRKVLDGRKDKAWNQGVISNAMATSIVRGESIPEVARRLAHDTANTDMTAMVRYARTAMTAAQNAGRLETMHQAETLGIHVRKQWLATLDRRTRDSHRLLDGQEQDVDKPFKSEYGDIMYPGDPTAHPADVWNCRCTLTYIYPKHEKAQWQGERYDQQAGETIEHMSYQEWMAKKEKDRNGGIVTRHETDATEEYTSKAKPGEGKVTYDKGINPEKAKEEIKAARFLRDTFGGDVHVRQEQDESEGIKYCDYIWRGKNWELKSPDTMKSPDRILGKALDQIRKNPGGIILDYQSEDFDLDRVINGARRRMTTTGYNVDLIILHKGKLMKVLKYKK